MATAATWGPRFSTMVKSLASGPERMTIVQSVKVAVQVNIINADSAENLENNLRGKDEDIE
jgi:hypothetical protein